MPAAKADLRLERLEAQFFLDGVREKYGFDLSNYHAVSLANAFQACRRSLRARSLLDVKRRILKDSKALEVLLAVLGPSLDLKMSPGSSFLNTFSEIVIPFLKTYPRIKIWQLGYSSSLFTIELMKILHSSSLSARAQLYVTGFTDAEVNQAKTQLKKRRRGLAELSFFKLNYLSDSSFNEFQAIIVSSDFAALNERGHSRVRNLLDSSLVPFGFLGFTVFPSNGTDILKPFYMPTDIKSGWFQRRVY